MKESFDNLSAITFTAAFVIRSAVIGNRQHDSGICHAFCVEFVQIAKLAFLLQNNYFHEQQYKCVVFMVLQVESFNIIGENTFIWMVEANNHTVSVVINTEYIFVQGCIRVIHEACNAVITIISIVIISIVTLCL